jgi:hypothetical protein
MFEELFAAWDITPPYTERDYFQYLDGKKRYDGVASLLRSRDVEVPWGHPTDPLEADTICGIGNRKNAFFERVLRDEGHRPVSRSPALLDVLESAWHPGRRGVELEERRRGPALRGATRALLGRDGRRVAERDHLASKPAPDVFVEGARMLGVDPARSAAVDDAISGVQSAAAGGFALVIGVDRGTGPDELRAAGAHLVVNDLAELLAAPRPARRPTRRRSPHDRPRPVSHRPLEPRREPLLAG